jgi:hypothetical protein
MMPWFSKELRQGAGVTTIQIADASTDRRFIEPRREA